MRIDFAIIDTDKNDTEIKDIINQILAEPVLINSITCPYYYLKTVKNLIENKPIILSCLIDFPLGISDSKTRQVAVEQAHKAGCSAVDIAMPQNLASNRKYDKIREDLKNISQYCIDKNIAVRYIMEYRVFDHHCLKKLCEILDNHNIKDVFPSSGYFIDSLADNLIASVFLYENSKDINIYCTGNAWQDNHYNIIEKTGLYGVRFTSLHSLKNFNRLLLEKRKNTQ